MKIQINEEVYNTLVNFCISTQCGWCPFGDGGYYHGTKCMLDKPEYWEILEGEEK